MRAAPQWGQVLFGIGLGLLIGAISNLVKRASVAATVLLLLAVLCLSAGLYLMRRRG